MDVKDYIRQRSQAVNGVLIMREVAKDNTNYCIECFEESGELNEARIDEPRGGWQCQKGHFAKRAQLATGGWA